jgi:hypothetical protein
VRRLVRDPRAGRHARHMPQGRKHIKKVLLRHPRPAWQDTDEVTREPVRASPSALIKHFWLQQKCKHKHTHILIKPFRGAAAPNNPKVTREPARASPQRPSKTSGQVTPNRFINVLAGSGKVTREPARASPCRPEKPVLLMNCWQSGAVVTREPPRASPTHRKRHA